MVSRNYDLSQTPSDSILIFPDVPVSPPSAGSFLGAVTSSTKLAQLGFFAPGAVYIPIAGGTMSGPLILSRDPQSAMEAATKRYTDTMLPLAGGQMSGPLSLFGDGTQPLHAVTKQQLDVKLNLAGGTMTGFLFLNADPTNLTHAATKRYTDNQITSGIAGISGLYLPIGGGTLTGPLTVPTITTSFINLGANDDWTTAAYEPFVWSIRDGAGNIALGLDGTGLLWIAGISPATASNQPVTASYVTANFLPLAGGNLSGNLGLVGNSTYTTSSEPGLVWSIRDGHGNVAVALDVNGTLYVAALQTTAGGGAVPNPPFVLPTSPGASGTWWNNGTFICVVP